MLTSCKIWKSSEKYKSVMTGLADFASKFLQKVRQEKFKISKLIVLHCLDELNSFRNHFKVLRNFKNMFKKLFGVFRVKIHVSTTNPHQQSSYQQNPVTISFWDWSEWGVQAVQPSEIMISSAMPTYDLPCIIIDPGRVCGSVEL